MNFTDAKVRHAQLVEEIRRHDYAYYVLGQQIISDYEYDRLYAELQELEEEHKDLITPDSPSQRVAGQPVEGFARITHQVPMLSLEKIKAARHPDEKEEPDVERRKQLQDKNTLRGLAEFDATLRKHLGKRLIEYVIEPKVDGVSIGIHYKDGKLALGVTRGDGRTGDDITSNIRTIRGIPLQLTIENPPALLEVRGEAYISKHDFEELNSQMESAGERLFPNARNATAGTLKQLDPRSVARRPIRAVFYAVGACEGIRFSTHAETLTSLKEFGLPIQTEWRICKGMEEVLDYYNREVVCDYHEKHDLRSKVPYEIDGIVIKVNDRADWERIPPKAKAPGYAIVHKPIPWITPAETLLKGITVQVGRTGVLTPVAELEPVLLQGSTISRATLHNDSEIARKDIRIGDTVTIRKAGMVIPEVVEAVKTKRPGSTTRFDLYQHVGGKCPACGGSIVRETVAMGDKKAAAWRCQNVAGCPAQRMRRLEYFAQRRALDIQLLGGIIAEKLVDTDLVKEPLDLFVLSQEKLARLNLGTKDQPRVFGEKNAKKLLEAVNRSRDLPLARWLLALAIPEIGEESAYDLAHYFSDLPSLVCSPLLKDTVELGELRRAFQENSIGRKQRESLPADAIKKRKHRQEEAKKLAEPIGKRLLAAGFAKPAAGVKPRDWQAVTLIGPAAAKALITWSRSPLGLKMLERMEELGLRPKGGHPAKGSERGDAPLAGQKFVLTGTLSSMSRDEAMAKVRSLGGEVGTSVTKNTSFLVVGEDPGATKTAQAEAFGVRQLTEPEFLAMLDVKVGTHSPRQQDLL